MCIRDRFTLIRPRHYFLKAPDQFFFIRIMWTDIPRHGIQIIQFIIICPCRLYMPDLCNDCLLYTSLLAAIILSLCAMCVSYRICSTSWFPYVPDEISYPLSCCSYAACILYTPMWFLYAQLPPRFIILVNVFRGSLRCCPILGIKKSLLPFARISYHIQA